LDDRAFSELEGAARSLLASVCLSGYYGPLNAIDEEIAGLCIAMATGSPEQRARFSESLDRSQREALGRFALRASVLALRSRERRYLHAGLLAHAILRQRVSDWRCDASVVRSSHWVGRSDWPTHS
jgi:hypothetical protein